MNSNNKLIKISTWANILSWIVLAFYFIYSVSGMIIEIHNGSFTLRTNIFFMFPIAAPLVSGAVFFIILQAIAAGAAVLLEFHRRID